MRAELDGTKLTKSRYGSNVYWEWTSGKNGGMGGLVLGYIFGFPGMIWNIPLCYQRFHL